MPSQPLRSDPSETLPVYRRIARRLRGEIQSGSHRPWRGVAALGRILRERLGEARSPRRHASVHV